MTPHTLTRSLDDRSYWRRLLAIAHPDRNDGDGELFVFLTALREHFERCTAVELSRRHDNFPPAGNSETVAQDDRERVPYDASLGAEDEFYLLTHRALSVGPSLEEPFRSLLALLLDCGATDHGRAFYRQTRGASYKQLGLIGHLARLDKAERVRWYEIARTIPLSEAHASHIISSLKRQAAA